MNKIENMVLTAEVIKAREDRRQLCEECKTPTPQSKLQLVSDFMYEKIICPDCRESR